MEKPDNHYKKCLFEPIDVIKKMLTKEEFEGFLKGNSLKYRLRAGYKTEGDIEKALQYEKWLKEEQDKKPQQNVQELTFKEIFKSKGIDLEAIEACPLSYMQENVPEYSPFDEVSCPISSGMSDCKKCKYMDMTVTEVLEDISSREEEPEEEPKMQDLKPVELTLNEMYKSVKGKDYPFVNPVPKGCIAIILKDIVPETICNYISDKCISGNGAMCHKCAKYLSMTCSQIEKEMKEDNVVLD